MGGIPLGNKTGEYNPFNPAKYIFESINSGEGGRLNDQQQWEFNRDSEINKLRDELGNPDKTILNADEAGSILGGLDRNNVEARNIVYQEKLKKAQEEIKSREEKKKNILDTQGKQGTILTENRGVDFAGKDLATGKGLR